MNSRDLLDALRKRHDEPRNGSSRAWVFAEEVRVATGWARTPQERDVELSDDIRLAGEQRIDAFAFHTWSSHRFRRIAYEVKVSRTDLVRELQRPWKAAAALALSNEFYLVVPKDLKIDHAYLPPDWGVLSYGKRWSVDRKAPWRDTPLPPYSFMLSVARNLQARAGRE